MRAASTGDSPLRLAGLGQKIKALRIDKSLSQKAFASWLSTSSGYISEIEQGKKIPGGDFFLLLKRVFEVDLNWLLAEESAPAHSADRAATDADSVRVVYTDGDTSQVSMVEEENVSWQITGVYQQAPLDAQLFVNIWKGLRKGFTKQGVELDDEELIKLAIEGYNGAIEEMAADLRRKTADGEG